MSQILKVLPKQTLRKYLFEFRVPLSYRNVVGIYETCATPGVAPHASGPQLMTLKRILETHRKRSGQVSKLGAAVEASLVEFAAEDGDHAAIALLAGSTLSDASSPQDDRAHANKLLRGLMDRKFPLAFKVSGDLAYGMGHPAKALQFYDLAVANGIDTDNSLYVECLRNIGVICFRTKDCIDLVRARKHLEMATRAASDPAQVADCHFYLAQILETNHAAAKYHLEQAAASGLREAFAPLAFRLLNHYGSAELAKHWFELGSSGGDANCHVGYFDSCMRLGDHKGATVALERIRATENPDALLASRRHLVDELTEVTAPPKSHSERWNF